jgi:hypothetical protein
VLFSLKKFVALLFESHGVEGCPPVVTCLNELFTAMLQGRSASTLRLLKALGVKET